MKHIYLFFILATSNVFALPIVNESVGTNTVYTVYADHLDKNLYYLSPNYMGLAYDEDGMPLFNYTEYKVGFRSYRSTAMMILKVANYREELLNTKNEVLSINPNAKFAPIPFVSSKLEFDGQFKELILGHSCEHVAGEYNSEQSCIINFSEFGRKVFRNTISKRIALVFRFSYSVEGFARDADDSLIPTSRNFMIAGRVGGGELLSHPELFTDWKGRVIKF